MSVAGTGWNGVLTRALAYNSGRVIALCRLIWASTFIFVLWLDPQQSAPTLRFAYPLLITYAAWAAFVAVVVWRNWWADYRFALIFHVIDIIAFLASVAVTEGSSADFTSPFLVFFAFLILAGAIRWGWQMALLTGLVVTLLYGAIGMFFSSWGFEIDTYRFGRRATFMSLLTLVMAWFALRRGEQRVRQLRQPFSEFSHGLPLQAALAHAAQHTFARAAVIGWADFEEPVTRVHSIGNVTKRELLGPKEFNPEQGFGDQVRLFDRRRGRSLRPGKDGRVIGVRGKQNEEFAALLGIDEALALPIYSQSGRGEILLMDIDGFSADHVQLGGPLSREICATFDRHTAFALANRIASTRMREAIARDLHDSVVQSLAGAAMRVEGLRNWVQQGGDPEPEIDAVRQALREEQTHVRSLIERLRKGTVGERSMDALSVFRVLLRGLETRWKVSVRLHSTMEPIAIASWMAHELDGILREAVANAVRHGGASEIGVEVAGGIDELLIVITDNGRGFADGNTAIAPRSISDRVNRWGGSFALASVDEGACLQISLPLEVVQ